MATMIRAALSPATGPGSVVYKNTDEVVAGRPIERPRRDEAEVAYENAYEIVDGQILEWPIMGAYPEELASILLEYLASFVRKAGLGRAIVEGRFQMIPERQRRPDLAFISFERWPKGRRAPNQAAWNVVPDLAVEVISKNEMAWDVMEKVREYFDAGVRAVWLVHPTVEVVHIYHSFYQIEVVTRDGTLDGGEVVPGFRLALADLFEGEAEPEAAIKPASTTEAGSEPTG